MSTREWLYDEASFAGTDFKDLKVVQGYDERHSKFRDYKKETDERFEALKLGPDSVIVDFGCGTGAFTINAAGRCKKIYAIDISAMMLKYTEKKAADAGLSNIEFINAGMLSYEHKAEPVDAVISSMVLHHLPDFWKEIALKKICSMIKPGGKFFLFDVVFSFDYNEYEKYFDAWSERFNALGEDFGRSATRHLSHEYSTFSWVMSGLLERAGFEIESENHENGMIAKYICIKR